MATLKHSQIPTVVTNYLEAYEKGVYTDIARVNQHSIFATYFENGVRRQKPKSLKYTYNYLDAGYSNVRYKAVDEEDSYNRQNIGAKGEVDIGFQDTHFLVNATEPAFNGGGREEIVNYLHYELQNMEDRFYEAADQRLFQLVTAPNDGSGDTPMKPHALVYWVPVPTANTTGAFNGTNASGYSVKGALDAETYTGLKAWQFTFGAMSPDDGLKKLFRAMAKCKFKPYYSVSSRNASEIVPQRKYQIFMDLETFIDYRQNSFGMNENFGSDVGKFQSETDKGMWASNPICWVPDDSVGSGTRIILGLDLSVWELCQYGEWFKKKSEPTTINTSHLQVVTHMDSAWTTVCRDPRCNFHATLTL